ncbi:uncharacterized protein LOC134454801 [Engraulis encrasicolus]|uniref:uncharacterized protein LOC134454801 n=1 Tax=Engraulis encrasicolus TaxID=184585 RepID=UPI002FCED735
MSFLGLCNYCRQWVPNYSELVKPLQNAIYSTPMAPNDSLIWTEEMVTAFCDAKTKIAGSTVLALPNYSKPFIQMVDARDGHMVSVLLQNFGEKLRPVSYYAKELDVVARATPPCVQAVLAAALAVQASAEVVLFHPLVLKVPHAVSILLLQTNMSFLSPARHLSCMTVLLSQPHVTIERCTSLNPATLIPIPSDGVEHMHDCETETFKIVKPRPDLQDTPLTEGDVVYVDGSACKDSHGQNKVAYAVTTVDKLVFSEALPSRLSAQAAEIIALTKACELYKDRVVTIYTDSQYAFSASHVFCAHWKRRGYLTSSGKEVKHKVLLQRLLQAIQLPLKIAICKCEAHTNRTDDVSKGNALADRMAKETAAICLSQDGDSTPEVLKDMQFAAPDNERQTWVKHDNTNSFEVTDALEQLRSIGAAMSKDEVVDDKPWNPLSWLMMGNWWEIVLKLLAPILIV